MPEFASFLIPNEEPIINKRPGFVLQYLNFNEPETPITLFSNTKIENGIENDETMRIFLRLRPAIENDKEKCYEISNGNDIIAAPPEDSASYRNFLHGYGKTTQKFTFSRIFPDLSEQEEIFQETTKPLIDQFSKGYDRLLFTYGTTSSGKTFTMSGNRLNVGIIPKSLMELFNGETELLNDPSKIPVDFNEVSELKSGDIQRILKEKAFLLKLSEKESSEVLNSVVMVKNEPTAHLKNNNGGVEYATTFWVTYTEIYNEMIHDLLDISQCQPNSIKNKRPILDIRTARNGGSYVKGLSCYPVFSAEEAYRLLLVGRRNQRTGATRLNQNSSRSHTIFTIRSVRVSKSSRYLTRVSNLSFCDLAGSERMAKAQTTGVSQKEACNINSSLLALGRCIEVLRQNQTNPCNMNLVPFRDSKLTRLFQTYLSGTNSNGKAAMIVCVNQDSKLFDETLQVLKFSALARKVVLQEKVKVENVVAGRAQKFRPSHFQRLGLDTPRASGKNDSWGSDESDCELDDSIEQDQLYEQEHQELLAKYNLLKDELIETKKKKIFDEAILIDKLNEEWSRKVMQMENDHSDILQNMREEMNNKMRQRAKIERNNAFAQFRKRRKNSDDENEGDDERETKLALKEREGEELRRKVKELEEECSERKETADILAQKLEKMEVLAAQQSFQVKALESELCHLRSEKMSIITIEAVDNDNCNQSLTSFQNGFTITPNKKKVFEIHEDDMKDSDEDSSFIRLENNCNVSELELELEKKTVIIKSLKEELAGANREVVLLTGKLVSRDRTLMNLNDAERNTLKTVDSIIDKMGLLAVEENKENSVAEKLEMIKQWKSKDSGRSLREGNGAVGEVTRR